MDLEIRSNVYVNIMSTWQHAYNKGSSMETALQSCRINASTISAILIKWHDSMLKLEQSIRTW